ncbi:hypothetical protein ACLB2K_064868 [Fragaria x ananassa]
MEICNVKLVSFFYGGDAIKLLLRNVPQFVEVSISSRQVSFGQCDFHHQLEVFRLRGFVLARTISLGYRRKMEIKQAPKYSHKLLRVVEVAEYHDRTGDFQLIKCLLENAVELKSLLIHPVGKWYSRLRMLRKENKLQSGLKN